MLKERNRAEKKHTAMNYLNAQPFKVQLLMFFVSLGFYIRLLVQALKHSIQCGEYGKAGV